MAPPDGMVVFSQIVELTGETSRAGDAWRNGVEMAVQEVNAAGGVLGRTLRSYTFDADNGPKAVQRAVGGGMLAVLGPLSSAATRVAAPLVRAAGLVEIAGADALELPGPAGTLFRAAPGPAVRLPRLAAWLRDDAAARRVSVVWNNAAEGRGAHDLLLRELRARGLELASDHLLPPGPPGFAAEVAALGRAAPDAAVVLLAAADAVKFLAEARRSAPAVKLVGDATLAAPRVLAQAGGTAEGVRCQLDFVATAAELAAFSARYAAMFKSEADAAAAKGYTAVGLMAGGLARLGRVDSAGLAGAMRGISLKAGQPAMMLDAARDAAGEMTRMTFMVEVRAGKPVVLRTLGVVSV